MVSIETEFKKLAAEKGIKVADNAIDDAVVDGQRVVAFRGKALNP